MTGIQAELWVERPDTAVAFGRLRVIASRVPDGGCQDGGMTPTTMMRPFAGPSGVR